MRQAASGPIRTYADFFPYYLRQHSSPLCRGLHYVGTGIGMLCLLAFIATGDWRLILAGIVSGYGFAWIGHIFVDRNRPATFGHPAWSFVADHHMAWLALTGRLHAHLVAAGVEAR